MEETIRLRVVFLIKIYLITVEMTINGLRQAKKLAATPTKFEKRC